MSASSSASSFLRSLSSRSVGMSPWTEAVASNVIAIKAPPSGFPVQKTGSDGAKSPTPLLFTPLTFRSLTLRNRLAVSPMCLYSSKDGFLTDFHMTHLGQYAMHGAGLIVQEATAVSPEGRITPQCAGLWKDEHEAMAAKIVNFVHSQGAAIGIQLGHAGRKASTFAPFLGPVKDATRSFQGHTFPRPFCNVEEGGWPDDVVGPSPLPFAPCWITPRELSTSDIAHLVDQFRLAAIRALRCDYDLIEIHAAHGYLISSFLSPLANQRTDAYGGSLQNRARFLIEVIQAIRSVWPQERPLFVRISCEEWVPGGWTSADSVKLTHLLLSDPHGQAYGVDLMDCSSGGISVQQQFPTPLSSGFQVPFAAAIRNTDANQLNHEDKEGKEGNDGSNRRHIKTGAVGLITTGKQAEDILQRGDADLIFIAREFLRNPHFALTAAQELGIQLTLIPQYLRSRV